MTYIITTPCIDVQDQACVEVCPVDCIHFDEGEDKMLYINPDECIDCGACEPACPESIDLIGMVTGLRGELVRNTGAQPPFDGVLPAPTGEISPPTMLIACQALTENANLLHSIVQQLGGDVAVGVSGDSGADISMFSLC